MATNDFEKLTGRDFDPAGSSSKQSAFRGSQLRGLEAFGWFGTAPKSGAIRHRIVDIRPLRRSRRDA